ncbi:patatin-like phospholipase [Oxobacter pfennigii]|uniref:Patatin-like phospholipase n=1 Tax=Oxobacter pfennigii TaxID=36849 RepID=A0A0P8X5F7_9CLOT|nr:patatin-like phospholipase family protein [Oxobacter pfennigii]KPU46029.1 patatin-like phospholipase [Oxobacter pfennigii]
MPVSVRITNADAVFEGGGVKGIALAGALLAAEEVGYRWVNVAGTSAGAIVASLIAVGYNSKEIKDIICELNFSAFNDKTMLSNIPIIGPILSIMSVRGVYKGDYIEQWLREKYKAKGKEKFKDIRTEDEDDMYKYKLRVIASDISQKRLLVLPQDIILYGIDPDELDIAKAVRMSMGIPLYYKPVVVRYKKGNRNRKSFIVDGGLLSNFPVWLFDEEGIPSWPTFGFKLVDPELQENKEGKSTINYILSILSTMMEAFDQRYIEISNFNRTIAIPTLGVKTTDFNLSKEKESELYNSGYKAAKHFFEKWNFNNYIQAFRSK